MRLFQDLILAHEGKRICVMGGAPSLSEDLEAINADLYISANEHGAKLRSVDYIVAMDEQHGSGKPMEKVLREVCDAPIISPCHYRDIYLNSWPRAPRRIYSGLTAAWVAYAMGAKVVFLAGFDGYGQVGALRKARIFEIEIRCPVREIGGQMGIWPAYRKGERFRYTRHASLDTLKGTDGLTTVRVIKSCTINRIDVLPGDEITAFRHEIKSELKHRMVREL